MFKILDPLPKIDARARRTVYREYLKTHGELQHVSIGCHNEMIMLESDPDTEEAVAILKAVGSPSGRVVFPRHLHTKGETTICLNGIYGEYLTVNENPDDMFEGSRTLDEFRRLHPGIVQILAPEDNKVPVLLHAGARWMMGDNTEHRPFGFIGEDGLLLGQIHWGGPNKLLE